MSLAFNWTLFIHTQSDAFSKSSLRHRQHKSEKECSWGENESLFSSVTHQSNLRQVWIGGRHASYIALKNVFEVTFVGENPFCSDGNLQCLSVNEVLECLMEHKHLLLVLNQWIRTSPSLVQILEVFDLNEKYSRQMCEDCLYLNIFTPLLNEW